jgi:hypothetical protein
VGVIACGQTAVARLDGLGTGDYRGDTKKKSGRNGLLYQYGALASFFFLGGAFTTGARPPKKHGPASRRPRPSAESTPPPPAARSTACRRDPCRRRTQHPSCYLRQAHRRRQTHWRVTSNWPPSPRPLHGATRSASSHPGRAHFGLPRRTCVCARHTAAPQRCRMWNICIPTAASRFSMRYRSAISSAPRFAMLARAVKGRMPSFHLLTHNHTALATHMHAVRTTPIRSSRAAPLGLDACSRQLDQGIPGR